MAASLDGEFKEKISKYIINLMDKTKAQYGEDSREYKALAYQYVLDDAEKTEGNLVNLKHYESIVESTEEFKMPRGIERLYKRQLVVDITMVCAAHCRYCLRAYYDPIQITKKDCDEIVAYSGADPHLREYLVTGGDPLMTPALLKYFVSETVEKASNIKVVRMGTRVPVQAPERIKDDLISFFKNYSEKIQFEIGLQVNHRVELTNECIETIKKLRSAGVKIYSQNVLLKGVNDDLQSLIDLYDELRYLDIDAHYLFHAIPMKGTAHLRTTVDKGLRLAKELTCSGRISGRAKPMFALMTDIGKIVMYEGSIIEKDQEGNILLNTNYKLSDRQEWNPGYKLPKSATLNESGEILVKYLDGED